METLFVILVSILGFVIFLMLFTLLMTLCISAIDDCLGIDLAGKIKRKINKWLGE